MTVEPTSGLEAVGHRAGLRRRLGRVGADPARARGDRHARPLRLHRPDRGRPHRPREPAPRLALHADRRPTPGRCTAMRSATSCACGPTSPSSPTAACASCSIRTAGSRTPATARCGRTRSTSPATRSTRATRAVVFGGRGSYTRNWFLASIPQQSQFALETRTDDVHVTLQRAVRRTSFFTVNDVYVQEHSFSGYWAQQIFFTDWLRFEGGLRGDFFIFDVEQPAAEPGPRSELPRRCS